MTEFLNKNEIDQLYEKECKKEVLLDEQIRMFISSKKKDNKQAKLSEICEKLKIVEADATDLAQVSAKSCTLIEIIYFKIQQIDNARLRASNCQKVVNDAFQLQEFREQIISASNSNDFEKSAICAQSFLNIDPSTFITPCAEEIIKEYMESVKKEISILQNEICLRFKEAASVQDEISVERFFKLFILLNMKDFGIKQLCDFSAKKLKWMLKDKIETELNNLKPNDAQVVIFSDIFTILFENVARILDSYQRLLKNQCGYGYTVKLVHPLQVECSVQSARLLSELRKYRNFNGKLRTINNLMRHISSSKTDYIEPRTADLLISEITDIHSQYNIYVRFLCRRIMDDANGENVSESERNEILMEMEKHVKRNELCRQMQELVGDYLLLEKYYMEECIKKAFSIDVIEDQTTSMVDDIFFIVRKCIRRANSCTNIDAVCAVINNACAVIEVDVCDSIRSHLKSGYSPGYLDITHAYQVVMQRTLQHVDSEQMKAMFVAYVNNIEICKKNTKILLDTLNQEIKCETDNDKAKLESCMSGFNSVIDAFKALDSYATQQLRNTLVKPRIIPLVETFLSIDHDIEPEEYAGYDANDPFLRELIGNLDVFFAEFKKKLLPEKYETLLQLTASEVSGELEKVILKTEFSRTGGIVVDKEVRTLVNYMSKVTSWSVRDKFSRVLHITTALNLEKVSEIMDYVNSESGSFDWKLSPNETRRILTLRNDFKLEDIRRLKLG